MKTARLSILLVAVSAGLGLVARGLEAQAPGRAGAYTRYAVIAPGETPDAIVERASRVVPSPNQLAWQRREFIAFAHFGMNTFTDREWGDGKESPALFNPSDFDARQWVQAFKAAGMKLLILTAKHHDGFCLWPTATTTHSVKSSPWRNGHGDVVAEVARACREAGLAFGVYVSPWDRHEASYGDSPRYNEFFRAQLRELLTSYGEIAEVWFDGANGEGPNGKRQIYDWPSYYRVVRELQPKAVIFGMAPDVRWVGTESGYGRETEWSVIPLTLRDAAAIRPGTPHPLDDAFAPGDLTAPDLGSREAIKTAKVLAWYPAETDVSIRPGWFYHAKQDGQVKTPEKLVDIYFSSVGRNGVLLLNVPPDARGRIADADVKGLQGMRAILDGTFTARAGGPAPSKVRSSGGAPAAFDVAIAPGARFDVAEIQERIENGQRIEAFTLALCARGDCRAFASGTTVGHKRLLRFPEVEVEPAQRDARVRLTIDRSRGVPEVAALSLFRMGAGAPARQAARPTFALGQDAFLLDGAPFQIIGCEIHPARVPAEYWAHRIRMARAMGCNTIAAYVFWNYHETSEGVFDFETGNRDIARFVRLAQAEGLWVLLRPGPYVCAEWDFGGIPPYLLREPDLKVRCLNPHYMHAAERYIARLARTIRPLLVANGGPILLVQIENEYGSYGNDRAYMDRLKAAWVTAGVDGPFYTADGPTPHMLEAGHVAGAAIGLDSGSEERHWELARTIAPGLPVFSSETYPGWLTHWGEAWARPALAELLKEVSFLLEHGKSFNFYVAHGGTNFGFTAGANSGGKGFEPDITSYDYDAPIDEQGRPTEKFAALRRLIGSHLPAGQSLPPVPEPIPAMAVPAFAMRAHASLWNHLPAPIAAPQPGPFEAYGQNQGLVLYRTTLVGRKSGRLVITDLHDYANVFLDGRLIGTLDRRLGGRAIDLPKTDNPMPVLDILVEGMGHINFGQEMIDRKGITDRVTLQGMTLMNWEIFLLPLADAWVNALPAGPIDAARPGVFFRGSFSLDKPADTFIDMTGYRKGVVWVNGHNLGRFWDIGPQKRLFCPAPWLKPGVNDIVVFDFHQMTAAPVRGAASLE